MIFVDSNVLIDIFSNDPVWEQRSLTAVELRAAREDVIINEVVYAELSPGFAHPDKLDEGLNLLGVKLQTPPKSALFLAGNAHRLYRRRGGTKTSVLPDFFIGAHAAVEGASLLTRDPGRVRAYFPTVALIAP